MQNDDWNRITSVARFMRRDFSLLPVTATTFYTQGILGTLFSFVFGIKALPYLTLLVSTANLLLLSITLYSFFNLNRINSLLISMIVFFNPLHIYSAIGFMTENYTLFFVLLSLYFFLSFEKSKNTGSIILSNIFGILAFLCKQNGIVLYAATIPYLLTRRRYQLVLYQVISLFFIIGSYYLLFPQTPEMKSKSFAFEHLIDAPYAYSLMYGIIIVLTSFLMPLVLVSIHNAISTRTSSLSISKKTLPVLFLMTASILLFFGLNKFFQPGKISWQEYPYFENTFERTGFLPRTVQGTKYQFAWNYDLYRYWDTAAKLLCAVVLASLLFLRKKAFNLFSIYMVGYMLLMVCTETFFDRYILIILPFAMLFFIYSFDIKNSRILTAVVLPFVFFLAFFSIQLAYDFVYAHNYIWTKSEFLVTKGIPPLSIYSSGAWRRLNKDYQQQPEYLYLFSFDSPKVNKELGSTYNLIDTYKPDYKPNIFINPAVYLYGHK